MKPCACEEFHSDDCEVAVVEMAEALVEYREEKARGGDLADCFNCGREFDPCKSDAKDFERFCSNQCAGDNLGNLIDHVFENLREARQ